MTSETLAAFEIDSDAVGVPAASGANRCAKDFSGAAGGVAPGIVGATGPTDGGVVGDGEAVGLGAGLGAGLGVDVGVEDGVCDGSGAGVVDGSGVGAGVLGEVSEGDGVGLADVVSGDGVGSTAIAGRAPLTTNAVDTAIAVIHRAGPIPNLRMRNPRHSRHSAFCRETGG